MSESVTLKNNKRHRSTIKGQVTRLQTSIRENAELLIESLETRKSKLEDLFEAFSALQLEIESENSISDHSAERSQFEAQYYATSDLIITRMRDLRDVERGGAVTQGTDSPNTIFVKQATALLPKIEIKPFDGNPLEWHSFRDTFQSVVHDNQELPAVQKFHLLKNALRGSVASVITPLNASERNYLVAWDLLQVRCNKPRQIIHAHLKALMDVPELTRDSPANLRAFAEQAQMHVSALKALELPVQHWDTFLVFVLVRKLDTNTRRAWDRTLENEELPDFEQLITFLEKRSRGEESEGNEQVVKPTHDKNLRPRGPNRKQVYVAVNKESSCAICKENHSVYTCSRFLNLSVRERLDAAKRAKLCVNCLGNNHFVNNCRFGSCKKCNRRHHTLLHFPFESRNTDPIASEPSPSPATSPVVTKTALTVTLDDEVLLGTAIIKILDHDSNEHFCRVLLDSGSQAHIMTDRFADLLKLEKHDIDLAFYGLNRFKTQANHFVRTIIRSRDNTFESQVTFVVIPSITGLLPSVDVDRNMMKIPKRIKLADPEFYKSGMIDALIGNNLFYKLLRSGQIKLCGGSVILQKTQLSWLVTGSSDWQRSFSHLESNRTCHLVTSLERCLRQFWEVEEVSSKQRLSAEELECERHFANHTSRDSIGRYIVSLPFNERKEHIGESRNSALKRFYALERRLHKDPILLDQYKQFLQEYLALGHMSEVIQHEDQSNFYLPHHAVVKDSSATTKVRVIFDASAKSSTGVSLNDALLTGPTIQDTLWSLLLRFRFHAVVLTADIEKMYRQILVCSEDTVYQRILWRDATDQQVKTFKLNTVTYGTTSAPFLAVRCLQQLAADESSKFPNAASIFKRDFYVDDLITGAPSIKEAFKLTDDLIALSALGAFHLRQ